MGFLSKLLGQDGSAPIVSPEAQVTPDASRCVQCGICSYNCPVGIDVRAHASRGLAIDDPACIACGTCIERCPRSTLRFVVPEKGFLGLPEGGRGFSEEWRSFPMLQALAMAGA